MSQPKTLFAQRVKLGAATLLRAVRHRQDIVTLGEEIERRVQGLELAAKAPETPDE